MILYHGTNADIEKIDLERGLRHKDFGKGFYLTPDKNREGIYSPEQAAKLLQDKYLDQQYYFGTERALCYLNKLYVESV